MKELKKIDILTQRIINLLDKLPQGALKYELKLLFEEYTKQISKITKEVRKNAKQNC